MACRAFFCDHRPDCEDLMCPGRPVTLHRVPFLHTDDGGKAVQGGFGVSLSMPLAEVPDEPITTTEEAEGWAARAGQWFLAAVTLACVAAAFITYVNS